MGPSGFRALPWEPALCPLKLSVCSGGSDFFPVSVTSLAHYISRGRRCRQTEHAQSPRESPVILPRMGEEKRGPGSAWEGAELGLHQGVLVTATKPPALTGSRLWAQAQLCEASSLINPHSNSGREAGALMSSMTEGAHLSPSVGRARQGWDSQECSASLQSPRVSAALRGTQDTHTICPR